MWYLIIGNVCLLVFSFVFIIKYIKLNKKIKIDSENLYIECNKNISELNREKEKITKEIENKLKNLKEIEKEIAEKEKFNQTALQMREEELNRIVELKKEWAILNAKKEVKDWVTSAQEAEDAAQQLRLFSLNNEIENLKQSRDSIQAELADYLKKQEAINNEISRKRQLEEQQDLYKIQLDEESKQDIEVLKSIRSRLIHRELLDKLIYTNYIDKPTKEMTKRVLNGNNPSGIYKVTYIPTGESYIGKSVTVATRWQNHVKSVYGLEGVADSQFQRALKKYGVENFTWELLEEVSKENLTEREIYYINFYDTKKYGFNQRLG